MDNGPPLKEKHFFNCASNNTGMYGLTCPNKLIRQYVNDNKNITANTKRLRMKRINEAYHIMGTVSALRSEYVFHLKAPNKTFEQIIFMDNNGSVFIISKQNQK